MRCWIDIYVVFFLRIIQYNADTHNTHAHTHPYEYTYANSAPISTSEGLSRILKNPGKYASTRI
jgi:hypothetical protein